MTANYGKYYSKNNRKINIIILQPRNTGHFSDIISFSHLFGFCEHYQKIKHGLHHTLILRRTSNSGAIMKSDE